MLYSNLDLDKEDSNSGHSHREKKRKLWKKAPDAPKRFKSAYICFIRERMEEENAKNVTSEANEQSCKVLMKLQAKEWEMLDSSQKLKYEMMAMTDKQRYNFKKCLI